MNSSNSFKIHRLAIEMDKVADNVLRAELNISYSRFYFLLTLQQDKYHTQHMLAEALGYSDPAVSKMVVELSKDGHVTVVHDPSHGRRRLVSITKKGEEMAKRAMAVLDACFSQVATSVRVDEDTYGNETELLIEAMIQKRKGDL